MKIKNKINQAELNLQKKRAQLSHDYASLKNTTRKKMTSRKSLFVALLSGLGLGLYFIPNKAKAIPPSQRMNCPPCPKPLHSRLANSIALFSEISTAIGLINHLLAWAKPTPAPSAKTQTQNQSSEQ